MGLKAAVVWLYSLAALAPSTATTTDETIPSNCSSARLFEELSTNLKVVVECDGNLLSAWNDQQRAALLLSLRNVTDSLHRHQQKEENQCPKAEVPNHGGLVCATVASKRYCKPMCNYGYDFAFLRRSRVYEECSKQTRYRWRSPYITGNTLAMCNKLSIQVSGAKSTYFPKDQDCKTTKGNSQQEKNITDTFIRELTDHGVQGQPEFLSLECGQL